MFGPFTEEGDAWQLLSVTATAPAQAASLRVTTRVYANEPDGQPGGSVYLDTVRVYARE